MEEKVSTSTNLSTDHEQSLLLLKTLPLLFVAELVAAVAIVWLVWPDLTTHWAALVWGAAVVLLVAVSLQQLLSRLQLSQRRDANRDPIFSMLRGHVLLHGLLFFLAPMLFSPLWLVPQQSLAAFELLLLVVASLSLAGLAALAASVQLLVLYMLLALLPATLVAAGLAWGAGDNTAVALLPLLPLAFLVAGERVHALVMHTLRTELRNRSLILYLDNARQNAEQLSVRLANEASERRETRRKLEESNERLEIAVAGRTQELAEANRTLTATSQRLQLALDVSRITMWEWSEDKGAAFMAGFEQLVGYQPEPQGDMLELLQQLIHPDDLPAAKIKLVEHLKGVSTFYQSIYRVRSRHEGWRWVEDRGQVTDRDVNGRALRMIGTRRDVTADHEAEEQRRLAATVFQQSSDGIFIFNPSLELLTVNDSYRRITGFSAEDILGRSLMDMGTEEDKLTYRQILDALETNKLWQGETLGLRKNGERFPGWLQVNAVYNDDRELTHYVGMITDLTDRKKDEEQMELLSNTDRLTGLANRKVFQDNLQHALGQARFREGKVALFYLNLDRFKPINESLGHSVGDSVLKLCAKRLQAAGPDDSRLARIDSDEFTLIVAYEEVASLDALARSLIDVVTAPFELNGHELSVGLSIGISLFPELTKDINVLVNQADTAMHQAKRMGGNLFQYYRSDMRSTSVEQLTLETSLRRALERNEFVVFYQPKLDLYDNMIRGAEALVRWQHPTMGLLTPGAFIPLAEETGLITEIGEWVLREACRQTALWHRKGVGTITTSVNLSAQQFLTTDVPLLVEDALKDTGLPPRLLEMELTETVMMDDPENNIQILKAVREQGCTLSLDDFGTGYSSLSYLKRFPIDVLKVDRAFVMDMEHDKDDAAITQAIITLAQSLHLKVIAEGVETRGQLDMLRAMGCDMIQGYLIAQPLPAVEMEARLLQQNRHRRLSR